MKPAAGDQVTACSPASARVGEAGDCWSVTDGWQLRRSEPARLDAPATARDQVGNHVGISAHRWHTPAHPLQTSVATSSFASAASGCQQEAGAAEQAARGRGKQPEMGNLIDNAMDLIDVDNPSVRCMVPKSHARPSLGLRRISVLVDLISSTRGTDILGRVYEYFFGGCASAGAEHLSRQLRVSSRAGLVYCSSRPVTTPRGHQVTDRTANRFRRPVNGRQQG
jgi:hypothetical protein